MTNILSRARETIHREIQALQATHDALDGNIEGVVQHLLNSTGRCVVTGIGKSAIVAQKIVATMNSTGTPSLYMHAADAIHGDLGMIGPSDTIVIISKSGETPEIKVLVPLLHRMGNTLLSITSNKSSYLAQHTEFHLYTPIDSEADPNNLAPTASTTAQMAMGDAIAVCLLEQRGFTPDRFAKLHPGGSLGKKLYLRVSDVLLPTAPPVVTPDATIQDTILSMTKGRVGATAVVDKGQILGIVTDGDLRRMMKTQPDLTVITAADILTAGGHRINSTALAVEALEIIQAHSINQLLVTDDYGHYVGMLHLHELIKEGLV